MNESILLAILFTPISIGFMSLMVMVAVIEIKESRRK
jgi:hypothetical protein